MKLSCFSAVMPVIGWNQCVKCVAPFSIAQSFMALATMRAASSSRRLPFSIVACTCRYVSFGSRSRMTASLNTMDPKMSEIFSISHGPLSVFQISINNKKRHWCPEILCSPRRHCRFNVAKYTPVAEKCQAGKTQFLSADSTDFSAKLPVFLSLTRANAVVYYIHGF
jgi:hypothetical protein